MLVAKQERWMEASKEYESWAVAMLDEEEDVESAVQLLCFTSLRTDPSSTGNSILDDVVTIDRLSYNFRNLAAHPHCQVTASPSPNLTPK